MKQLIKSLLKFIENNKDFFYKQFIFNLNNLSYN